MKSDHELAVRLCDGLDQFGQTVRTLPGIHNIGDRDVLVRQFIDSVHRTEYVRRLRQMTLSPCRTDPHDGRFDPLKAASIHAGTGDMDEAFWLVFLAVHFGKHRSGGWSYVRQIYGRLGSGQHWTWDQVSADPQGFSLWLGEHATAFARDAKIGGFSNHRKYESISKTGLVVATYVAWVLQAGTHQGLVGGACTACSGDRGKAFDLLYRSMCKSVQRFGRLASFDYLAMLGKLELADIEPSSPYLLGSNGPLVGARQLFGDAHSSRQLDTWSAALGTRLGVGMQVVEDALCNWQKSPHQYCRFFG